MEQDYKKMVNDLRSQINEAKEDKKRIATTLESVMLSHNELQEALEQLQVDLGRKDHELMGYKQEERRLKETINQLQTELETMQRKLFDMETKELNEIKPLKNGLEQARSDNNKMAKTMNSLLKTNTQLQESLEKLQIELGKKDNELKRFKESRLKEDSRFKDLEAKLQKLEITNKLKIDGELDELRKELEKSESNNSELTSKSRTQSKRIKELEKELHRCKEKSLMMQTQLDIESKKRVPVKEDKITAKKLKSLSIELAALEKAKKEYILKNEEQANTIKVLVSEINGLQTELSLLAQVHEDNQLDFRDNYTMADEHGLQSTVELQSEKQRYEEQAIRAKEMLRTSRQALAKLANYAQTNKDGMTRQLHEMQNQLDLERSRSYIASEKLDRLRVR
ncbi:uncharacterized protein TRIADDRAFT_57563 [Trichoplax adhaerens]|uniref:Uncharacterized protein n=1 Tax=Trichoplax adhaerens TaxID=10228 RepID=B3RZS8_TRIAD|nr:hypothetical protein TRIADDRAFT_57563 [Trichoplax adhaerens]EDV24259.1 hypothetical protein TRIADDRAFT_57563 [Trichoplax adhaerens]|eukprot:XP_002113785.1 hypothetical protein TRIADDRAFT_57563 [Trichoplax adhaerens]